MNNGWIISRLKTHIDIYARVGEDSCVWGVSGNVSVELLTIPVPAIKICLTMFSSWSLCLNVESFWWIYSNWRFLPFDTIQLVPFHIIVADQFNPIRENCMGWDWFLGQSDCADSWWQEFIIIIEKLWAWHGMGLNPLLSVKLRWFLKMMIILGALHTPHIMAAKNGGSHEEKIKYVGERNTMKTKLSDIYENGIGAE